MAGVHLQLSDHTVQSRAKKATGSAIGTSLLLNEKPTEAALSGIEQSTGSHEARIAALEAELRTLRRHVRNTLTLVQVMAVQARYHISTPAGFQEVLGKQPAERARSNDWLTDTDPHDATLRDVISGALHPYSDGEPECIAVVGPAVLLSAELAVTVGLCFHELVTNAVKHGSLSVPAGRVDVSWNTGKTRKGETRLDIRWREHGGPAVKPPRRLGFGSQLLKRGMPRGGTIKMEFQPDGLQCRLGLPLNDPLTPET